MQPLARVLHGMWAQALCRYTPTYALIPQLSSMRNRVFSAQAIGFGDQDDDDNQDPDAIPAWKLKKWQKKRLSNGPWLPEKRLSRDLMNSMRLMHETAPETHNIARLSKTFGISAEAVVRILKSRLCLLQYLFPHCTIKAQ
jgi:hypothetical protein